MTSAPVLALSNFAETFVIEANACNMGIGAVLTQTGRLIASLSKSLSQKNQALSVYKKELLTILIAATKWRQYFEGTKFIIRTYQQSIKHLIE